MQIIGEKINTVNKNVAHALNVREELFFKNLVQLQLESRIVSVIDVNVGSDISIEPDNMKWAAEVVGEAASGKATLSIDSSYPKTIIAGVEKLKGKGISFINSITLKESRYKELLPVARQYGLNLIGLPIEKGTIPKISEERLKNAYKLAELAKGNGIPLDKLYIDCIIEPVSIGDDSALVALETVRKIKDNIPEVKTFICLSAVSFGLPGRKLLNRNFLSLLIKQEIDSIILDPLDEGVVDDLYASTLLTGKDKSCMGYIKYIKDKS